MARVIPTRKPLKKKSTRRKVKSSNDYDFEVKKNKSILDTATPVEFGEDGLKVCVYGRSGTGKTTFWATFPKPILAVVCSGGKRSGELRSIKGIEGITKIEIADTDQLTDITEALQAEPDRYATVVLDHASYLQDLTLKEILDLDEVIVQKSWGVASQQQYGQLSMQMKKYLRSFLELPQNVVIVAQEREFNVEQNSEVIQPYVGAGLTPSVTGWLNPACDYIFQTYKAHEVKKVKKKVGNKTVVRTVTGEEVRYYLRTGADPVYTTKFRMPKEYKLPPSIVDPCYTKVMGIIDGNG